jgi:putative membrane protein
LFDYIAEVFDLSRNHYDRLGHFAQGFVPATISREILLRTSPLNKGKWLFVIVISICLAISACYELLEWTVAEISKTAAEAFLGTQGDVWDTQKDMAFCLAGAVSSLLFLGKLHDKSLKNIKI